MTPITPKSKTRSAKQLYHLAPSVSRVTPKTQAEQGLRRVWAKVDARSVASGQSLSLFEGRDMTKLTTRVATGRGRPAVNAEFLMLCVIVGAVDRRSWRNLEGHIASLLSLLGIDPALAPDHSTMCKHVTHGDYDQLCVMIATLTRRWRVRRPDSREYITVAIDATGLSLTSANGWAKDKPGSIDTRRNKYDKLHCGIDVETGEMLTWVRTAAVGKGTGDSSVGPALLDELAHHPKPVRSTCADGAYGGNEMFAAAGRLETKLLTPLRDSARWGNHPGRDVLLTQQVRRGVTWWKKASGYNMRSLVENTFSVTKNQMGNRLRSRLDLSKDIEVDILMLRYNYTRLAGL
jgi:hypothetical protein